MTATPTSSHSSETQSSGDLSCAAAPTHLLIAGEAHPKALGRHRYATYLKWQANETNRMAADDVRLLKAEIDRMKEEHAQEWAMRGQMRVEERKARQKHTRKLQQALLKDNCRQVRAMRSDEAAWEVLRNERQRVHEEQGRQRVIEANVRETRLDTLEAAQDAKEREEFSRMRRDIAEAAVHVRERELMARRQMTMSITSAREKVLSARAAAETQTSQRGVEKRQEARLWEQRREDAEAEYLARAKDNRLRAQTWRTSAKRSLRKLWKAKSKAAVKERGNDHLVAEEKARIRESNRREVQAIYRQRFADAAMRDEFAKSPMARLQRSRGASQTSSGIGSTIGDLSARSNHDSPTSGSRLGTSPPSILGAKGTGSPGAEAEVVAI